MFGGAASVRNRARTLPRLTPPVSARRSRAGRRPCEMLHPRNIERACWSGKDGSIPWGLGLLFVTQSRGGAETQRDADAHDILRRQLPANSCSVAVLLRGS